MARTIIDRVLAIFLTVSQLEFVKYIALVSMLYDHVSAAFFDRSVTAVGRLALPLFALALSDGVSGSGNLPRLMARLIAVAVIAQPFYMFVFNVTYGNVLFVFALGVAIVWLWDQFGVFSVPGVLAALWLATFCEGSAFASLVVVAGINFFRRQSLDNALPLVLAVASLQIVNGSPWALLSLLVYYAAGSVRVRLPRVPRLFYVVYPAHLMLLSLALLPRYL